MTPVISVIGHSGSGKTTFLEKLIGELKSRDYKIATIKHAQEVTFDDTGRDSWRHIQAGSDTTIVSSPEEIILIKPQKSDADLNEVVRLLGDDYDIIITEGFKQRDAPKIEVHRKETGPLLSDIKNLIAIATDENIETSVKQFPLTHVKEIADYIEEKYIIPNRERLSFYVNNKRVSLSTYPKDIITRVLIAIATSLKGVGNIDSINIFLKKSK